MMLNKIVGDLLHVRSTEGETFIYTPPLKPGPSGDYNLLVYGDASPGKMECDGKAMCGIAIWMCDGGPLVDGKDKA